MKKANKLLRFNLQQAQQQSTLKFNFSRGHYESETPGNVLEMCTHNYHHDKDTGTHGLFRQQHYLSQTWGGYSVLPCGGARGQAQSLPHRSVPRAL